MENNSEQQVMKLLDDGLIYDFDNIVHNWQYVFDNVDNNNPINSSEFPLVVTEQPWNTSKTKLIHAKLHLKHCKFRYLVW